MSVRHDPVLLRETLGFLLGGAGLYLDGTLGDGGHACAVLEAEPLARLLGNDRDHGSLDFARARLERFGDRVTLHHGTFRDLPRAHAAAGGELFAGALFDFGLSSRQIDDPARGISFMHDGPLDQRMDAGSGLPLDQKLAVADEAEVAQALRDYGDVRGAGRLARAIVAAARAGELSTTRALAALVGRVTGDSRPKSLAPVFQALRIWVNDEMRDIDGALAWLPDAMRDGGVVVTLSYHSGEDRRVKHALRGVPRVSASRRLPVMDDEKAEGPWEELTRKVVVPSIEEQDSNPRARSARLRAFRRKPR
ncbi:MAG: 16S rRNA (cytosine(1402)-N(4))-methyltransferase RsmH [Candidatus Eisenbacteria bacterium]|nr:16S rRNA (cytosine(1402)-N(4))-methyltransferase RsmH [Candidatus Eisenbacteria bacterium]